MAANAVKLTDAQIEEALAELDGWELQDGPKLHKQFKFRTFGRAMGWMTSVAIEADKLDHHPNWSNSYNKVTVDLWTHSLGAISQLDIALARKMNELA